MLKKIWKAIIDSRMAHAQRLVATYQDYRTFSELSSLSDKQLSDIGIARADIARHVFIDGAPQT